MLDVNIKGMTYSARHGFRALKENNGGALVFTSSVGGSMSNGSGEPFPAVDLVFSIYTATKSYLDCLARGATSFNSKHNIRTYAISSSVYLTGMNGYDSANGDAVSMVVNPIIKDYAGDADDVAAVVEAMFDGTTKWKSGSNVCCEGPYTYNVHERYQMMYDPKYFGVASPALPLEILCNHLGEPVTSRKKPSAVSRRSTSRDTTIQKQPKADILGLFQ